MNEENSLQSNEPVQSSKNIWVIVISVIITALIIGGGVYAWQRFNLKSTEQDLQQQIENLQSQLNQFQQGQIGQGQVDLNQENTNTQTSNRSQSGDVNNESQLTPEQKTALQKCESFKGAPRLGLSQLYGDKRIFCSFGQLGECTQRELNSELCFITNWETYQNDSYGFEFKYPGDWSYNGEESIILGPNDIPLSVSVENEKSDYYFNVSIDKNWSTSSFYYDASTKESVVIDKVKYTAYIFPYGYEVYEPEKGKDYSTFTIPVKKGNLYYIISGRGHAKTLTDYNDILSTFKFTK